MRKSVLLALGLAGLGAVIGVLVLERRPATPPALENGAVAALPAAQPSEATKDVVTASVPPTPPPPPAAPDLPTIAVDPLPIHTVPDVDTPVPKVTLFDRNGKEIGSREASAAPSPPPQASRSSALSNLVVFGGAAEASGGTNLVVSGKPVRLFGVRVADPRDQCGLGPGDKRSCAEVARDALAQRLQRAPRVNCHTPEGQRGDPAAVCTDASGTDLGGFLVAEGLALADTSQSYDYYGSEGVARSFRRGLWHYR